jgi:hypothetical protein
MCEVDSPDGLTSDDRVYPVIEDWTQDEILAEFDSFTREAFDKASHVMYSRNLGVDMAEIGDTQ